MANPFVHVELSTPDVGKARAFYGKLFNWKAQEMHMPEGTYTTIDVGGGTGGGMMAQPDAPSAWMPYVLVDDVRQSTDKARELGAEVCKDVSEVPNMGWFSVIKDPAGATLGLWQTKSQPM